jgi:Zn-finger nucleic acid-binding protein
LSPHPHRTCPRCDTTLMGGEPICPQCKMALSGSKLVGGSLDKVVCPICKIPTYEATFAEQTVSHCAECKGMGLKRESVMKLQPYGVKELTLGEEERRHKRPPYFEPRAKPPFLICPFCKKRMKGLSFGRFPADLCESCGSLWLEEGKLPYLNEMLGPYKWKVSQAKR